jgi:hypothetical protein
MTSLLDWHRNFWNKEEQKEEIAESYAKLLFKNYNIVHIEEITGSIKILFADNTTEIYSKDIFCNTPIFELLKKHLIVDNNNDEHRKEIIKSLLAQDEDAKGGEK